MTFQLLLTMSKSHYIFLNFLNNRHRNIKFTREKQINRFSWRITFINNQNITFETYRKSIYTGLLLNFKSFTSFSYKISLIKCVIDRSVKTCNIWKSFHIDIENIKPNLIKNAYLPFVIDKVIKKYLNFKFSRNQNELTNLMFIPFRLSYISNLSHHIKINFRNFAKSFVKKILTLT